MVCGHYSTSNASPLVSHLFDIQYLVPPTAVSPYILLPSCAPTYVCPSPAVCSSNCTFDFILIVHVRVCDSVLLWVWICCTVCAHFCCLVDNAALASTGYDWGYLVPATTSCQLCQNCGRNYASTLCWCARKAVSRSAVRIRGPSGRHTSSSNGPVSTNHAVVPSPTRPYHSSSSSSFVVPQLRTA